MIEFVQKIKYTIAKAKKPMLIWKFWDSKPFFARITQFFKTFN